MFESLGDVYGIKGSKSKTSTSRLQCWNNLVNVIADKSKSCILCVFLYHCTTNIYLGQNIKDLKTFYKVEKTKLKTVYNTSSQSKLCILCHGICFIKQNQLHRWLWAVKNLLIKNPLYSIVILRHHKKKKVATDIEKKSKNKTKRVLSSTEHWNEINTRMRSFECSRNLGSVVARHRFPYHQTHSAPESCCGIVPHTAFEPPREWSKFSQFRVGRTAKDEAVCSLQSTYQLFVHSFETQFWETT